MGRDKASGLHVPPPNWLAGQAAEAVLQLPKHGSGGNEDHGWCVAQGRRSSMEDAVVVSHAEEEVKVYGAVDGHNGSAAAALVQRRLPPNLKAFVNLDGTEDEIKKAVADAFFSVDKELAEHWLLHDYPPSPLPKVSAEGYLHGQLGTSRTFGGWNSATKEKCAGLLVEPHIDLLQVQPGWEFLVIATDGVWQYVSTKEALQIVRRKLRSGRSAKLAAEELVRHCLARGGSDNISVAILVFRLPTAVERAAPRLFGRKPKPQREE